MKYEYAAIFTPEENGLYSVHFPDLRGCYTCGDDFDDAVYMAHDVLNLTLYDLEQDNEPIPEASNPRDIMVTGGQSMRVIAVDTETYRRFYASESVASRLESRPEIKYT